MRALSTYTARYYLTYLAHALAASPLFLFAILLQHLWSLSRATSAGLQELRLEWRYELAPTWASFFDLFTPSTWRRARSLARGAVAWGRFVR